MSLSESFDSSARSKGEADYHKNAVFISQSSETLVRAFVKSAGQGKVTLTAEEVDSAEILAQCTCTAAKKGTLCRHIYASILKLEDSGADFLLNKEFVSAGQAAPPSARESAFQDKQAAYKEAQKERLKDRAKEIKERKRGDRAQSTVSYPQEFGAALAYFSQNGFALEKELDFEHIEAARRQLARVFHPDKGGSHDEILELNRQFEVLTDYLSL
jgi:hypothetical protein